MQQQSMGCYNGIYGTRQQQNVACDLPLCATQHQTWSATVAILRATMKIVCTTTTVWDGQPYQGLHCSKQGGLQWNIARDAPMEYCVRQCGCEKQKEVCNCYHRVQSTTESGVRQRSIAREAAIVIGATRSIVCHNT